MPLHPRGEAEQARHVAPPFAPKSLAGTGLAGASAGQAVGPLPLGYTAPKGMLMLTARTAPVAPPYAPGPAQGFQSPQRV